MPWTIIEEVLAENNHLDAKFRIVYSRFSIGECTHIQKTVVWNQGKMKNGHI